MEIPPFYFVNGAIAKNLSELEDILNEITEKDFEFHVNQNKNDLANWIETCLNNKELSTALRKTTDKDDTIDLIQETLTMHSDSYSKTVFKPAINQDLLLHETIKKHTIQKVQSQKHSSEKKVPPIPTHTVHPKKQEDAELKFEYVEEKHPSGITKVHKITAEAPHEFILKEFLAGAIFGLLLGLILMAALRQIGAI